MMATAHVRWLGVPVCIACLLPCARAAAERPTPERQEARDMSAALREAGDRHERAFKLYDEGAYDAALSELKRAYELAPTFRILYNLGVMSLAVHDHAGAMQYFESYLEEGAAAVSSDVREQVAETLRELALRVAMVTIQVNVAGAQVLIDDRPVGTAPLESALRLNAGSRRFSAHADGWLPDSKVLSLAGGDRARIALELKDPQTPLAPVHQQKPSRSLPWVGLGATALFLGGAVLSSVEALAAQRDFERTRRELDISRSELEAADRKAFYWSVAADSLSVAALAAGGYSLYLVLSHPEPKPAAPELVGGWRVDITATGVTMSGGF
jgi:tetratricopeptide (TPR) repeat protein